MNNTTNSEVSIKACAWRVGPVGSAIRIVERGMLGDVMAYAVVNGHGVANKNMEWEFEPSPSNRDESFIARTRWTEWLEACQVAKHMALSES